MKIEQEKCSTKQSLEKKGLVEIWNRTAYETKTTPTLCTLREMLLEQLEPEAKQIALSLELYTTGSMDIFGYQDNVDLDKRVVVFDIHGLGAQLKPNRHAGHNRYRTELRYAQLEER